MEMTLEQTAQSLVDNMQDYAEHPSLPDGHILGVYLDGVWIVDASETCDMNKMPRIRRVLDATWANE